MTLHPAPASRNGGRGFLLPAVWLATAFVVSLNLHRRHLDESQRAKVAAKLENLSQGRPRKDANSHDNEPPMTRARAAELLNVGTRTWPTGTPKKNSANLQSYEPVSQSRAAELTGGAESPS